MAGVLILASAPVVGFPSSLTDGDLLPLDVLFNMNNLRTPHVRQNDNVANPPQPIGQELNSAVPNESACNNVAHVGSSNPHGPVDFS